MLQKTVKRVGAASATNTLRTNADIAAATEKAKKIVAMIDATSLKALRNKVLDNAIKLFERRGGWTTGVLAADKDGEELAHVLSREAVSFCAIGGIERQKKSFGKKVRQAAVHALNDTLPEGVRCDVSQYGYSGASSVVEFNDTCYSKRRVIALFVRAKKAPLRKEK